MTSATASSTTGAAERRESAWVLVGLGAIAASTLLVEIVLTKFFSYKVQHHFTYAVLSLVMLGIGGAGVWVYLRPHTFAGAPWAHVARYAAAYGVTLPLSVVIFAWIPLEPANPAFPAWLRSLSLPLYFFLFAVPFFFAGVCVTAVLSLSRRPLTQLYFWDLLAAAAGASACPFVLRAVGGYGAVGVAAAAGMLAFVAFRRAGRAARHAPGGAPAGSSLLPWAAFAAAALGLALYPGFARARWGFDVLSTKDDFHRVPFVRDFGGIAFTAWNAIARIDVSHTGESKSPNYRFGLPLDSFEREIPGRYVLVDGGANTRQLRVNGTIEEQEFLGRALWAAPYAVHGPAENVLVIGGGGGIDILVGKKHGAGHLDVAELNEATWRLLSGTLDADAEREQYLPWLRSDERTRVDLHHSEGRNFAARQPDASYDVIQASGVDTLTAITSGGMSLVENYLYTTDAVLEYLRILRPDGILSLTHWRAKPPHVSLRMTLNYLEALERLGIAEAWRHVAVVASPDWVALLAKKTPFDAAEAQRLRDWAEASGWDVLADPSRPTPPPGLHPSENVYVQLAHLSPAARRAALQGYPFSVEAVGDDRPFFYHIIKVQGVRSAFASPEVFTLFVAALLGATALALAPLLRVERRALSRRTLGYALFFAACGFSFLLFQTLIAQLFSVFVGGPVYTLAVVLVGVLGGYALGSLAAGLLPARPASFVGLAVGLACAFLALHAFLPGGLDGLRELGRGGRIAFCFGVVLLASMVTGMPVPLAMSILRERHGSLVGWMWGVNSAFNVIGAMCFVPISQLVGFRHGLLVVAALYAVACLGFAGFGWRARRGEEAVRPEAPAALGAAR